MNNNEEKLVKAGAIWKRSPRSVLGKRVWQKRWCFLVMGKDLCLEYYRSNLRDSKPAGRIYLADVCSVVTLGPQNVGKRGGGKDLKFLKFNVHCQHRVYELKAQHKEAEMWANLLSECLVHAKLLRRQRDNGGYELPPFLGEKAVSTMRNMTGSGEKQNEKITEVHVAKTVSMMSTGNAFIRYFENKNGVPSMHVIYLFFQADDTLMGSLYWCDPQLDATGALAGKADVSCRLPLHEISDVILGKTAELRVMLKGLETEANDDVLFSLKGKSMSLNLEADSKAHVSSWLFGLNSIITTSGKGIQEMSRSLGKKRKARGKFSVTFEHDNGARRRSGSAARAGSVSANTSPKSSTRTGSARRSNSVGARSRASSVSPALVPRKMIERRTFGGPVDRERALSERGPTLRAGSLRARSLTADRARTPSSTYSETRKRKQDSPVERSDVNGVVDGDVLNWLSGLGQCYLGYSENFLEHGVNMEFMKELEKTDLQEIGITNEEHLSKLLFQIKKLKFSQTTSATSGGLGRSVLPKRELNSSPQGTMKDMLDGYSDNKNKENKENRRQNFENRQNIVKGIPPLRSKPSPLPLGKRTNNIEASKSPGSVTATATATATDPELAKRASRHVRNSHGGSIADMAAKMARERMVAAV